jgi:hypothetical protein
VRLCEEFSSCDCRADRIWIAFSDEMIYECCFCESLASVTFDTSTKVSRFNRHAFSGIGLTSIYIPSSVEVICEFCFVQCKSLASVTFDAGTKVSRFDGSAFSETDLTSIHIPSSVEVI